MSLHRALTNLLAALCLCGSAVGTHAQSIRDLNLQFHGYATEAFIYSTNNNWNTTNSTDHGSFRWTEEVASVSARPASRLRLGAQARFYLLGTYGPKVTLDWASMEFKVNERFGFRAGKVKSPGGLLNEVQDIDPAYLWVLLPQSIYPLASRTSNLAVHGGVLFGTIPLGERFGKVEYRAFGGERVLPADDGYFEPVHALGLSVPQGERGPAFGGTLTWRPALHGLTLAAAIVHDDISGRVFAGTLPGMSVAHPTRMLFSARYEHRKLMVAGEYCRVPLYVQLTLTGLPPFPRILGDEREFYGMASYKPLSRLTSGIYYSSTSDRQQVASSGRYQKDWALASRYDLNSFLYFKLEQHFLDGTHVGFSMSNNPNGLQETSRLTFAKLGVTF